MISGLCSKNTSKQLKTISSQLSNARVVLRLIDDASMLRFTLSYGLGKFVSLFNKIIYKLETD